MKDHSVCSFANLKSFTESFQQIVLKQLDTHIWKKEREREIPQFLPFTKINSKWIIDQNAKPQTKNLLEEWLQQQKHNI